MDIPVPSTIDVIASDVVVERNVMVTMRDGIRLATDIYRPAVDGKPVMGALPALMERTPYGKGERSRSEIEVGMDVPMDRSQVASFFARAGYAVIYQDCRGRYASEGEFTKYLSEAEDGFDTAGWLVKQPWSNGQFGTMGLSYAAHTQAALACLNPPGLACMVMDSGGFSNAFLCGIRQGGAFELKQATWAYSNAKESALAAGDKLAHAAMEAEDIRAWFAAMPWSEGVSPVRWAPEYESYLLEQWRSGSFDESWRRTGLYMEGFYDTFPDVPIVLMSSWYDAYVRTILDNYSGLNRPGRKPLSLIMGPGLHGNRNSTFAGDVSFGPTAPLGGNVTESWLTFRRNWFDHWLKGIPNVVSEKTEARIFAMGGGSGSRNGDGRLDHGGRWIEAGEWPLPGTSVQDYFLHANGQLSPERPTDAQNPLTYDFDPQNPVPSIGGSLTSGAPIFEGGGFDQRESPRFYGADRHGLPLSARADVLTFETEPLDEDMLVAGPIEIELFVASDAPDTDFTAKLIDVYPPSADYPTGYALNITDGIIRCRYRNSWDNPEPITAGEIFKVTIEPFATANLFAKGHRVRVDISSSNFPKYDVNPNTYAPEGRGRTRKIARNTVYCDATHASAIRLPLVPAEAMVDLKLR
ncbi:MAG: CocE/NonD family hydrolase [Allorhizobium sp.]